MVSPLNTNNHFEGEMMNDAHSVATLLAQGGPHALDGVMAKCSPCAPSAAIRTELKRTLDGFGGGLRAVECISAAAQLARFGTQVIPSHVCAHPRPYLMCLV